MIDRQEILVLVVDDEADQFRKFEPDYKRLFSFCGCPVHLVPLRDARELAKKLKDHPHAVVCDIDLGPQRRFEGLEAIKSWRTKYPDVLFAACTREAVQVDQFGTKFPNPDLVIAKKYLGEGQKRYTEYLSAVLRTNIRRNCLSRIEMIGGRKQCFARFGGRTPSDAELRSLLSQVTFVGHDLDATTRVESAELRVPPGSELGRSGSAVIQMRTRSAAGTALGVPGILKISKKSYAEAEIKNYEQFVKWILPYTWRVDVLGAGYAGDFGAVCYSFVHGGSGGVIPVTDFIRQQNTEVIDRVLGSIFSPEAKTWYNLRRPNGETNDLSDHYKGPPHFWRAEDIEEAKSAFWEKARALARKEDIRFDTEGQVRMVDRVRFYEPTHLLFTRSWGSCPECVCHGDLNAGNIMADEAGEKFAFIDFQHTGYSHLFRDFITFESSIRGEFPDRSGGKGLIETIREEEKALDASGAAEPAEEPYLAEVRKVRQVARENFPREPWLPYVFGFVVHHLRLVARIDDSTSTHGMRMVAAVIAGLRWLEANGPSGNDA